METPLMSIEKRGAILEKMDCNPFFYYSYPIIFVYLSVLIFLWCTALQTLEVLAEETGIRKMEALSYLCYL